MEVGEGMVAVVRGLRDSGLTVTLLENGKQYTLLPNSVITAPSAPNQPSDPSMQSSKMPSTQSYIIDTPQLLTRNPINRATANNLSPDQMQNPLPQVTLKPMPSLKYKEETSNNMDKPYMSSRIDSGAQATDGRYVSTYRTTHCNMIPTSPPDLLTEFPPQRPEVSRGHGNFQVGGAGSGDTPFGGVKANGSFRGGLNWPDRGSVCNARPSREPDPFANSLRKYPNLSPERSSEIIERLINYTQTKNVPKTYARTTMPRNESVTNSHDGVSDRLFKNSPTASKMNYDDFKNRRIEETPTRDRCKKSQEDWKLHPKPGDVRHLRDMSKRTKENIRHSSSFSCNQQLIYNGVGLMNGNSSELTDLRKQIDHTMSVHSPSQAAVAMVSREVFTQPRKQPVRRNVAVPLSPSPSTTPDPEVSLRMDTDNDNLDQSKPKMNNKKTQQTLSNMHIPVKEQKYIKTRSKSQGKLNQDGNVDQVLKWLRQYEIQTKKYSEKLLALARKLKIPGEEEKIKAKIKKFISTNLNTPNDNDLIELRKNLPDDIVGKIKDMNTTVNGHDTNSHNEIPHVELPISSSEVQRYETKIKHWLTTLPQDNQSKNTFSNHKLDDVACKLAPLVKEIVKSQKECNSVIKRAVKDIFRSNCQNEIVEKRNIDRFVNILIGDLVKIGDKRYCTEYIKKHTYHNNVEKVGFNNNADNNEFSERELKSLINGQLFNYFQKYPYNKSEASKRLNVMGEVLFNIIKTSTKYIPLKMSDELEREIYQVFKNIGHLDEFPALHLTKKLLRYIRDITHKKSDIVLNSPNAGGCTQSLKMHTHSSFSETYLVYFNSCSPKVIENKTASTGPNTPVSGRNSPAPTLACVTGDSTVNLQNYYRIIEGHIEEWLKNVQRDVKIDTDRNFRKALVMELSRDIVDRMKYKGLNLPRAPDDDLENLKYQIFKCTSRIPDNVIMINRATDLMEKVKTVTPPNLMTATQVCCQKSPTAIPLTSSLQPGPSPAQLGPIKTGTVSPGMVKTTCAGQSGGAQTVLTQKGIIPAGPILTSSEKAYKERVTEVIFDWYHNLPFAMHTSDDATKKALFIEELAEKIDAGVRANESPSKVIDAQIQAWTKKVLKNTSICLEKDLEARIEQVPYREGLKVTISNPIEQKKRFNNYENAISLWISTLPIDPLSEATFTKNKPGYITELSGKVNNITATYANQPEMTQKLEQEISEWMSTLPLYPYVNKPHFRDRIALNLVNSIKEYDQKPANDLPLILNPIPPAKNELEDILLDWMRSTPMYKESDKKTQKRQESIIAALAAKLRYAKERKKRLNLDVESKLHVKKMVVGTLCERDTDMIFNTVHMLKGKLDELIIYEKVSEHDTLKLIENSVRNWYNELTFTEPPGCWTKKRMRKYIKKLSKKIKQLRKKGNKEDVRKAINDFLLDLPINPENTAYIQAEEIKLMNRLDKIPIEISLKRCPNDQTIKNTVAEWSEQLPLKYEFIDEKQPLINQLTIEISKCFNNPENNIEAIEKQTKGIIKFYLDVFPIRRENENKEFYDKYATDLWNSLMNIDALTDGYSSDYSNLQTTSCGESCTSTSCATDDSRNYNIVALTEEVIVENLNEYARKVAKEIDTWLIHLNIPETFDKRVRAVIVNGLTSEIVERHKFFELNPKTYRDPIEEEKYLEYQIYKWINDVIGPNVYEAIANTPKLMHGMRNVPAPIVVLPPKKYSVEPCCKKKVPLKTNFNITQNNTKFQNKSQCQPQCSKTKDTIGCHKSKTEVKNPSAKKRRFYIQPRMSSTQLCQDVCCNKKSRALRKRQSKVFNVIVHSSMNLHDNSYNTEQSLSEIEDDDSLEDDRLPVPLSSKMSKQIHSIFSVPKLVVDMPNIPNFSMSESIKHLPPRLTLPQLYDYFQKVIAARCFELPLAANTPEEQDVAMKTKASTYGTVWKIYFKLVSNPETENNYVLFETLFEDIIDDLLDYFPQTIEMKRGRHNWKIKLVKEFLTMQKYIHRIFDRPAIRYFLKQGILRTEALSKLAKTAEIFQHMKVNEIAESYLLMINYKNEDPIRAEVYKQRVMSLIDKMIDAITQSQKKDATQINMEVVKKEILLQLQNMNIPQDDVFKEEVEEVLIAEEVKKWYLELPLIESANPAQRERLLEVLAKKIHAIEHLYEICPEEAYIEAEMKHEISDFLATDAQIVRKMNETLNYDAMVEELTKRLKNRKKDCPPLPGYDSFKKQPPLASTFIGENCCAPPAVATKQAPQVTQYFVPRTTTSQPAISEGNKSELPACCTTTTGPSASTAQVKQPKSQTSQSNNDAKTVVKPAATNAKSAGPSSGAADRKPPQPAKDGKARCQCSEYALKRRRRRPSCHGMPRFNMMPRYDPMFRRGPMPRYGPMPSCDPMPRYFPLCDMIYPCQYY